MHGKLEDLINGEEQKRPLLLYISGDDKISKEFEKNIITRDGIIFIMNEGFECLGIIAKSVYGQQVVKRLGDS